MRSSAGLHRARGERYGGQAGRRYRDAILKASKVGSRSAAGPSRGAGTGGRRRAFRAKGERRKILGYAKVAR